LFFGRGCAQGTGDKGSARIFVVPLCQSEEQSESQAFINLLESSIQQKDINKL